VSEYVKTTDLLPVTSVLW